MSVATAPPALPAASQYSHYQSKVARNRATSEPAYIRWLLITIVLIFLSLFLIVPLAAVFTEALSKGFDTYLIAITEPDALSSIKLTFIAALIAVPLNLVFGIAAEIGRAHV